MRILFKSVVFMIMCCSYCFAQTDIIPLRIAAKGKKEIKFAIGTVEDVLLPEPAKGIHPSLTMVVAEQLELTILIEPTTTIYHVLQGALHLNDIKAGDTVKVRYETADGNMRTALSIYVLNR